MECGLEPQQYKLLTDALAATLAQVLGAAWTTEQFQAWGALIACMHCYASELLAAGVYPCQKLVVPHKPPCDWRMACV